MNNGKFDGFGGMFVPETLMGALHELSQAYEYYKNDKSFQDELNYYLTQFAGRPTPLTYCERLSGELGCRLYLKREDLLHSGAHKINNTLGQALLAKKMGKKRLIAETGAGQHGVASAIAGAALGLEVEVYMGEVDIARQELNVYRMELLGATVHPVKSGQRTLKDSINEAMRDWVVNLADTHYLIGSVVGAHPFPTIVRDFQTIIGHETRRQVQEREGRLPDRIIACVGGGSNSIGIFHPFLNDPVKLYGAEAGGKGLDTNEHGASLCAGEKGILHGALSYLLSDKDGQILPTHSVSAGLDYPSVGPEHSMLKDRGRVTYEAVTDDEALLAFSLLSKKEGIIPALESCHAIALAVKNKGSYESNEIVIVNLSGRGDKDLHEVARITRGEI